MMDSQPQNSIGDFLNNAQREQNDIAKTWWWITRGMEFVVLSIGIAITIWNVLPTEMAILASFISIGSVITQWISDYRKNNAQAIQRKFEFLDALGWDVSSIELRNLHITLPKSIKAKLDKSSNSPYNYFSSTTDRSQRRLMENLTESSFFSQHLAKRSAQIFGFATVVIFVIAVIILLLTFHTFPLQSVNTIIARVVITILAFLFTAGFIRLTYDYYHFSQISNHIEESATVLLKQKKVKLEEAIKLYHEYQIARAGSPLIPTFVWKSMRDELNKRWNQYDKNT